MRRVHASRRRPSQSVTASAAAAAAVLPGSRRVVGGIEPLERRVMLCTIPIDLSHPDWEPAVPPIEDARGGPEVAVIDWINRGQTDDNFASVFGANANAARAVVDAAIDAWERVITSFNYGSGTDTFNLTLRMSSTQNGLGAAANVSSYVSGKPKAGTVTISRGTNGSGAGWFIDPTPGENAEFVGTIDNAYSGDAQAGSPALNMGDLYTVTLLELTHTMGIINGSQSLFQSGNQNTDTNITDNSEGGGVGTFYTFNGDNYRHLMTSNNGGGGGSDFGLAIHSAGPTANVNFGATNWRGANDVGNAIYELSRRYLIGDSIAGVLRDAYNYSISWPSGHQSFYAVPQDNGTLLVRGGLNNSADLITISGSGTALTVSVDVGNDVPGTGSAPGVQNLPAFVRTFDTSEVSNVVIQAGDGNDTIRIQSLPANVTVNVDAGTGDDMIFLGVNNLGALASPVTLNGGTGNDTVIVNDAANASNHDFTIGTTFFSRTSAQSHSFNGVEDLRIAAGSGNNLFSLAGSASSLRILLDGGGGTNTYNIATGGNISVVGGPLEIIGTLGTDTVNLNDFNTSAATTWDVTTSQVTRSGTFGGLTFGIVETININAGSGADTFNVAAPGAFIPRFNISAGLGNDAINAHVLADVSVIGGGGTDNVVVTDTRGGTALIQYEVTDNRVRENLSLAGTTYSGVEGLTFNGGAAPNLFQVLSSAAGTPLTLNGNGGNDNFSVGGSSLGTLANILGNLTINGGAGSDNVNVWDFNNTANHTYTIQAGAFDKTSFPLLNFATAETFSLSASSGSNQINVEATAAGVGHQFSGNGGNDTFNLAQPSGDLDNLAGAITLVGGNGVDQILLFDGNESGDANHTIDSNEVTRGGAFAGVTYGGTNGNESLFLAAGTGNDTINIESTPAMPVTVGGGNGNDTINVGHPSNQIDFIDGPINVIGGNGSDSLFVNDQGDAGNFGFTVTSNTVERSGAGTVTYSGLEVITVNAGNAPGGGNKTHDVLSLGSPDLFLNAGIGSDTIRVSPTAQVLGSSGGDMRFDGQGGNDLLVLNDAMNAADESYFIGSQHVENSAGRIFEYANVESLNLNGASGNAQYTLDSLLATTALALSGNVGDDAFNLGSGNNVDAIDGPVTINGAAGTDAIDVNDLANSSGAGFTLTPTTFTRTGMGSVRYGTVEQITLNPGGGSTKTHTINGTAAGTPVRLNPGPNRDVIDVRETSPTAAVSIGASAGGDSVDANVDNIGAAHVVFESSIDMGTLRLGNGGFVTVVAGGSNVLRPFGISIAAGATLDLNDNSLIVDYAVGSPLAAVRAALASGYAGGAWNGSGIVSGVAAANPGRTLGYAEASAIFSSFPATFAGQAVDDTTVVVRYTRPGDADLDGQVNLADFNRLAGNFGQSDALWSQGNFNYDGTTNLADFNLLAANFGQSPGDAERGDDEGEGGLVL